MDEISIQTVCGFGCGSSLFLRMKIEEVLKENNIKARVFCGDVGTCLSQPCDVIFISEELYSRIEERSKVPVVPIVNFMNKEEVAAKTMQFINEFQNKQG
ncbi:MAG: PTS sugar transporter subunit IIB [Anaerolineaceae bacterium]